MHTHPVRNLNLDETPDEELDDPEAASLTDELDKGLVPPMIPDDPEHDRLVDPED